MLQVLHLTTQSLAQWTPMTVYDVLQEDCRGNVSNNDVGDPAGDAYFNLKDMYLGVACPACNSSREGCRGASTFDCTNPESTGNLVVRKITVEVLLPYGTYELCNAQKPPGDVCDYSCRALEEDDDKQAWPPTPQPTPGVGNQAVCGGDYRTCDMAPQPSSYAGQLWDYWDFNTAVHMGKLVPPKAMAMGATSLRGGPAAGRRVATTGNGQWYSLDAEMENKFWRNATIQKVINAECQRVWLIQTIETTGKSCFEKCPGAPKMNASDPCWVGCFFDTAIGVGSGSSLTPTGGMAVETITTAWLKGFESIDPSKGGCPPCPAVGDCPPPPKMEALLGGIRRNYAPIRIAPRPTSARGGTATFN